MNKSMRLLTYVSAAVLSLPFYGQEVRAATIDGGLTRYFQNCMNGSFDAESVSAGAGVTNWAACMLIFCQRNQGGDACLWYDELIRGGIGNMNSYVQDLKNFLAIQQLEYVRDKTIQEMVRTPKSYQTSYSGYKSKRIEPFVKYNVAQRNWQLYIWDMFNTKNYTDSSYIYEHFSTYCSYFESEFPRVQHYCGTAKMALPYDFLASSLLGTTSIKGEDTEYLYKEVVRGSTKYYFAHGDDELAELKAARPGATEVDSYPRVNKQKAALAYIRNVTSAVPLPAMKKSELFDDPENFIYNQKKGIPYMKTKLGLVTSLSLARESLLRMYADRLPNKTVAKPLSLISDESYETSLLGLLEYESKRRFEESQWYRDMVKLPKEALVREITNMMALQANLNFRTMSHLERIEALLAASLAYNVNSGIKEAAKALVAANDASG